MFELIRNYGNGYTVKVTGAKMVELVESLVQADEMFSEVKASALVNGQLVESTSVRWQSRDVEANGRKVRYYEQVCVEPGPLQWYKRHVGQFQDGNGMYVQKGPPKENVERYSVGKAGWAKYNGDGTGGGYKQGGGYQQPQQPQQQQYAQQPQYAPHPQHAPQAQPQPPQAQYAPQPQYAQQPPQQRAPQPQYNPHAAPAGVEDIPF